MFCVLKVVFVDIDATICNLFCTPYYYTSSYWLFRSDNSSLQFISVLVSVLVSLLICIQVPSMRHGSLPPEVANLLTFPTEAPSAADFLVLTNRKKT